MLKKRRNVQNDSSLAEASPQEISAAYKEQLVKESVPSGKAAAKQKLRELWADKRKFSVRAVLAALCALTFSFTFIVFGPYELYIQSMQYLTFKFSQMVLPMALAGLLVFAVLFIILVLLRGKLFNYALSGLFAVTLAGYLQGNFLNVDHGSLDGSAIPWADFASTTLLNIVIWLAIAVIVLTVMYFSRRIWAVGIQLICVMLIGAQVVALCSLLVNTEFPTIDDNAFISDRGAYEVSEKNNVVFFLLDRFDNSYVDEMFNRYPDFKGKMNGFTYYNNFTGSYTRTMPSVVYLLTGVKTDYSIPYSDYFTKAWSESTFLKDIRDAGNKAYVYSELAYVFGSPDNLRGKIDNLSTAEITVNHKLLYKYMLGLSAYRYSPEALKPSFWMYTGDLAAISTLKDSTDRMHTTNDYEFWRGYREQGLTVDEETNGVFAFHHFAGAHNPFYIDENAEMTETSNDFEGMYKQIAGNMNMIFKYIDELKEKGLYDNTTIIISADHGETGTIPALNYDRVLSLFIKPAGADTSQPLQTSNKQICQDNLRASIVSYFGLDTSDYGRTIESIGEDEEITRYFWMQASEDIEPITDRHRDYEFVTYEIKGDANNFNNWTEVDRFPIKYPFYDAEETAGL